MINLLPAIGTVVKVAAVEKGVAAVKRRFVRKEPAGKDNKGTDEKSPPSNFSIGSVFSIGLVNNHYTGNEKQQSLTILINRTTPSALLL